MEKRHASPLLWMVTLLILFWVTLILVLNKMSGHEIFVAIKTSSVFMIILLYIFVIWIVGKKVFDTLLSRREKKEIDFMKKFLFFGSVFFGVCTIFFCFSWLIKNILEWMFSFTKNDFIETYRFLHWFLTEP